MDTGTAVERIVELAESLFVQNLQTDPNEGVELDGARFITALQLHLSKQGLLQPTADAKQREWIGQGEDPAAYAMMGVVAGARLLALYADILERSAGHIARQRGATIRQLSLATGISERAASVRYRRDQPSSPAESSQNPLGEWMMRQRDLHANRAQTRRDADLR